MGFCAGTYEIEGEEAYNAVRWALEVRGSTLFDKGVEPDVMICNAHCCKRHVLLPQAGYRHIVRTDFLNRSNSRLESQRSN